MKFIRQIIIGLAILAAFVILSIFSTKEYTEEKINLDNTEDRLPGVNFVLSSLSNLLLLTDKIPIPDFLSVEKKENSLDLEMIQGGDNFDNSLKSYDIKDEKIASGTAEIIKNTSWVELFKGVKEALSKDWFRP